MLTALTLAGLLLTQAPAAQEPFVPTGNLSLGGDGEATAAPQLDEAEALLIENYLLRLQALQAELDRRRQAIEARIAGKYPGWVIAWDKGQLVKVEPPATEPEP